MLNKLFLSTAAFAVLMSSSFIVSAQTNYGSDESMSVNRNDPDFQRRSAIAHVDLAEQRRSQYRHQSESDMDSFVRKANQFDNESNQSYVCTIFVNEIYKTAFGDKTPEIKVKIFDSAQRRAQDSGCSHENYNSVKYGG